LGFFGRVGIEFGLGLAWIDKDGLERKEGKDLLLGAYIGFCFLFYLLFLFLIR
jgi:hypothetical protein